MREDWMKATGFPLRNSYTTLEAGTVMSEPLIEAATEGQKLKEKKDNINSKATMELLPGVSSRIVR